MSKLLMSNGLPLVNIVLAEIKVEGEKPLHFGFDTAQEAVMDPSISEGEEELLRTKNKILATNKTEDIVYGYDITLTSNTLIPELFALIDGGDLLFDEDGETIIGYRGPRSGITTIRKEFTLNLYTEEKDTDGNVVKYVKFTFRNCKGKPVSFNLTDGEFFIPEMVISSRPKTCEAPIEFMFLDELPELDEEMICPVDVDVFGRNIQTKVAREGKTVKETK